ncbi:MAG: hypothetical protein ACO27L_02445 [Schleiferiaceae bacterium]
MLRVLFWLLAGGVLASCGTSHLDRYALDQNPNVTLTTHFRRGPRSAAFTQTFTGIKNEVGMDRHGNLRRHVLWSGATAQSSYREGQELVLPLGRIPAPTSLYHVSSLSVLPLLAPEIRRLAADQECTNQAATAPAGDLVEIQWRCTVHNPRERHYVARYEVTTAELRYERHFGRWRLASAEYSERGFVQRWNRIPRR